jgi:ABC-type transport system involved in cytochrome c biogenesis permease subunit
MKKHLLFASIIFSVALIAAGWLMSAPGKIIPTRDAVKFEQITVLKGGRLMPVSSAAADTLRLISGKSTAKIKGKKTRAAEWLLYVNAFPGEAAKEKFFKTDNRELQNLMGVSGRYYSLEDIQSKLEQVYDGAYGEGPYASACAEAFRNLTVYMIAENAFAFFSEGKTPNETFENWKTLIQDSEKELKTSKDDARKPNQEVLAAAYQRLSLLKEIKEREDENRDFNIYAISDGQQWLTPLDVMLDPRAKGSKFGAFSAYGNLVEALSKNDMEKVSAEIDDISKITPSTFRRKFENAFNRLDIFTGGAILYLLSFVLFALARAFKKHSENLAGTAFIFLSFAACCHAFGVGARMYIQMRPPVTNLYSSIIFAGIAAVALGIFLAFKKRKTIYGISTAPVGFFSILIALLLPYSGDTMGMMRAVLNSNFWLTTHIVPMMLGYCGVFLAGFTATFRLLANAFSLGKGSSETLKETTGSVYGILCFAMVFSFAGTMLGGIWADLSWGRFWGWDPKENGALMVVLWCAFIVHCRALKIVGDRAVLALACIGNVIAAWAWFGVNMMGVGLHSYGFMDSGKFWLLLFIAVQSACAFLAMIPTAPNVEKNALEQ